jgi:hypothetical protein
MNMNPKAVSKEPKLKNPQFQFYTADLNTSSDASFINNSFKDSRIEI